MASQLNSNNSDIVLNATGTDNDLVFQQNGVEKGRVGAGGFGKVLQVVSVQMTDTLTTTSTAYTDILGLTATITPKSTSSKILVLMKCSVGANSNYTQVSISNGIVSLANVSLYDGASTASIDTISADFLDSPNSISPVTYKGQWRTKSGTGYINRSGGGDAYTVGTSSITLMEIGA